MLDIDAKKWLPPAEWVARELRRCIMSGEYPGGAVLPGERRLAEVFNVGRRSVRAALAQLDEEGLISRTQGSGTRVLKASERKGSGVIGVIANLASMQNHPEGRFLSEGIQDRLKEAGYAYEVAPLIPDSSTFMMDSVRAVQPRDISRLPERFAAVVFVEMLLEALPQYAQLEEQQFPMIVANLEKDLPFTATIVDHGKAMRDAVGLLASLGHRRIAYVGRNPDRLFYGESLNGYRDGMQRAGLPVDESLVTITEHGSALESYVAARPLFQRAEPPTAVVTARDVLAQGVCQLVEEAGGVVGRDVSVVGFDDNSWVLDEPYLTTFREPCYEMGRGAAQLVMDRLVHGWRPPERKVYDAQLILRRSVGPVPIEVKQ